MADDIDNELDALERELSEDDSNSDNKKSNGKHSPKNELKATLKGALPYSLGGGLLGALGGYLFTGGSKSESQSDRSKRRLKNALILGLMGAGVGGSGKVLYDFATDTAPPTSKDLDKAILKAVGGFVEKSKDSTIVKSLSGLLAGAAGQSVGGKIVNSRLNKHYGIIQNYLSKKVSGTPKSIVDASLAEAGGDPELAAKNKKYYSVGTKKTNAKQLEVLTDSIKSVNHATGKRIGGRAAGGLLGAVAGYELPKGINWALGLLGENADENIDKEE